MPPAGATDPFGDPSDAEDAVEDDEGEARGAHTSTVIFPHSILVYMDHLYMAKNGSAE